MSESTQGKTRFLLVGLLIAFGVIILASAWGPLVTADTPPKELPPFEGEPVTLILNGLDLDQEPSNVDVPANGGGILIDEDFEGNWQQNWNNVSFNGQPYMWGDRTNPRGLAPGNTVNWAVGGGLKGKNLDADKDGYPNNVNSWLITKQPLDLSDAVSVKMTFDLYLDTVPGDRFTVATSTDGSQFLGEQVSGTGGWKSYESDLGSRKGQPKVYIAFIFESEDDNQNDQAKKLGALLDNIVVTTQGGTRTNLPVVMYTYTRTPDPVTPTPTSPPPGSDYLDEFTDDIAGWSDRRATFGTDFSVSHDPSEDRWQDRDETLQGFLNVLTRTGNSHYVIVSPLVQAKPVPYNIETVVKLRSDRNTGDQYGIVFGGNYNPAAGECQAPDLGECFTQYYEMRVRFYYDEPADKDRMEMKLKRIDSVDENNNNHGDDLINWTGVAFVEEDDFIEWDITVESDGKIKISANDNPVADATDSAYINNPYFGVIVRTEDKDDSEARYDFIKVD